jgi:hypothetical protein
LSTVQAFFIVLKRGLAAAPRATGKEHLDGFGGNAGVVVRCGRAAGKKREGSGKKAGRLAESALGNAAPSYVVHAA